MKTMGILLDDPDGIGNLTGKQYWEVQLRNKKVLLQKVQEGILHLSSASGANNIVSYTIDTGQDKQTVTRADLSSLKSLEFNLQKEIAALEMQLHNNAPRIIQPGY